MARLRDLLMAQGLSASALGGRAHTLGCPPAEQACLLALSLVLPLPPVLECVKVHSPLNPLVFSDMDTSREGTYIF